MEKGLIAWIAAAIILALTVNLAINALTTLGGGISVVMEGYKEENMTVLRAVTTTPFATVPKSIQAETEEMVPEGAFKPPEALSAIANIAISMIVAAIALLIFRKGEM